MKPPIYYHYFRLPLPYNATLALQEKIHALQLAKRKSSAPYQDILLLIQHRPVYTLGRRQSEDSVRDERIRLTNMGADVVTASRGGLLTYHGPGQLVGYPLIDLSRFKPVMGVREYVCRLQKTIESCLQDNYGIVNIPSDHTGVFLTPTNKVASIGVGVRHRLTTHGFSLNVTKEPLAWFDQVVACGLADVRAVCVEASAGKGVGVEDVVSSFVRSFGRAYDRETKPMDITKEGEVEDAIRELEMEADTAGPWSSVPRV
jgi:lipoate-protein ligase B